MNQTLNPTFKLTRLPRVAIVAASWHKDIVGVAVSAIRHEFDRCRIPAEQVSVIDVPGAFEIPLHAKRLALSGRFDAVIACGLVVDGGIYRHDFVAQAVISALMQVQLETDVPVFSAVLTPHHFHEHGEHKRFFAEHFSTKGVEVARACLATMASLDQLNALAA
ncbi:MULTISPECIES: 6,7-dimethyl-8-ribityllumazine synthase [unclassified Roseateles]|uniref:6,7-dimethyl-8-ribityllumazine synthase n=1 Tax=unclassified Roseateles TaxID=2626991 RepID=UPI0006F640EC|nr:MULTISPECIES: 6,7-dimethyl-8-ribityllumazine synthase [unclassified Roseateles]KQW51930.1 riboflavin synthase subunit beta [Pelomonas sp. Root405]KRA78163.1 riboflavin synthase subunit beta [Pelomonas sp. Root662]